MQLKMSWVTMKLMCFIYIIFSCFHFFQSLSTIFQASQDEFSVLPDFGPKKVARAFEIFHQPFCVAPSSTIVCKAYFWLLNLRIWTYTTYLELYHHFDMFLGSNPCASCRDLDRYNTDGRFIWTYRNHFW